MTNLTKLPKDAWAISRKNTALVVIDMERAFCDEGAPRECAGAKELVPKINELAATCRKLEIPVIYVKLSNRADLSDAGLMEDFFQNPPDTELLPWEGMKGSEFCSGLDVHQDDYIVPKIRFSAFIQGSSGLEPLLRGLGRDSIIVCGVVTDICVGATTIDAMMLGFKVFLVGDLTVTKSKERQKIALELYNLRFAKVMSFDEVMKELRGLVGGKVL